MRNSGYSKALKTFKAGKVTIPKEFNIELETYSKAIEQAAQKISLSSKDAVDAFSAVSYAISQDLITQAEIKAKMLSPVPEVTIDLDSKEATEFIDWNLVETELTVKTTMVSKCLDNQGLEEYFDIGVDYVIEETGEGLHTVYDRYGEKRQVMTERFDEIRYG